MTGSDAGSDELASITTRRAVAGVAGVAVATVAYWIKAGYLPSAGPWTETQVRAAGERAGATNQKRGLTHGTAECWRANCRRPECRAAHNAAILKARRDRAERKFPREARERVLRLLAEGVWIDDAAAEVGLRRTVFRGRARWDPQWRDALEQALLDGRNPTIAHGAEAYRRGWCVCKQCYDAHAGRAWV